jgi:hypothetical protein
MRFIVASAFVAALVSVSSGNAAVFERDWKTAGDGLLTYDDVNHRVWLDLSQTILSSQFPGEVPSQQATRENRYQYVVSQTGPGGMFEGFTVAKRGDVIALAESAGIDTSTLDENVNADSAAVLTGFLGITVLEGTAKISIGILDEPLVVNSQGSIRPSASIFNTPSQAGLAIGPYHFQHTAPPGVMLYRAAIPEPATLLLAILSAVAILLCRSTTPRLR